jgi:hypothetical protein
MRKKYTNILGKKSSREYLPLASVRSPHQRIALYNEARMYSVIASYLNAVATILNQVRLAVIDDAGNSYNDLLPRNFQNQFTKAIIERIVYGSGVLEVTYTKTLEIADVCVRPIPTFLANEIELDENNNIVSLTQQAVTGRYNYSRATLPREKLIIINENPDLCTGSKLEGCISEYIALKNLEEILLIGADRALVGVPHFQLPDEPTDDELNRLEAIAASLHSSDDLLIITRAAEVGDPSTGTTYKTGYGFDLKTVETSPLDQLNAIIHSKQKTLATVLMSQFLLLDGGSYALSKNHSDLFLLSLKGLLEEAIDDIERDLLLPLADEKGLPPLYMVASDFVPVTVEDLNAMLPLVTAGVVGAEQVAEIAADVVGRDGGM